MTEVKDQLNRIENTVGQILEIVSEERLPISDKWLTEPQVMKILNFTKRRMNRLRRENLIMLI